MPFDIGESINWMADAILKAPLVKSVMNNPIYHAIVMTFMIVLTVMFLFRDADTDDSLLVMGLRTGVWVFLMLVAALFLNNKVLMSVQEDVGRDQAFDGIFKGGNQTFEDSVVVPISINTDFTHL